MKRLRWFMLASAVVGVVGSAAESPAVDFGLGLLKRRQQSRPDAQSRAKQLVETLRNDLDEGNRKTAAQELLGLDPRTNPDVVPALTTSLLKDPSPAVRVEAVKSLGKLKPISQPAGLAMEAALTSDPDAKVREAIKAALWQYDLNGYKTPQGGNPLSMQTAEPPLAVKTSTSAKPPMNAPQPAFHPIKNTVGKAAPPKLTPEPPLAPPKSIPLPATATTPPLPAGAPRPMPSTLPVETTKPPALETPTVTVPQLTPPDAGLPLPSIPVPTIPTVPVPPPTGVKF